MSSIPFHTEKVNFYGSPDSAMHYCGFFTVDRNWTVRYFNEVAEKLLNIAAAKMNHHHFMQILAPELALTFTPAYHTAFLRHSQEGHFCYWGAIGPLKDLSSFLLDGSLSFSFKTNEPLLLSSRGNEDTGLHSLAELYRLVTEITDDALWEWNFIDQQIFWIDGGHKRILGYPLENALIPRMFWESLVHDDDKKDVLQELHNITETGWENKWEKDYRLLKQDGSYAWVHERGRVIYENNKAVRMIGATRDTTKTVLLEKKLLEESSMRHRQIAEAVLGAQELERQDLALELNENVSQMLVAVNMFISIAKKDKNKSEIYLERSSRHLKDVLKEIKKMYRSLVAPDLKLAGLFDNIKNLLYELENEYKVSIEFNKPGIEDGELKDALPLNIYRLVQDHLKCVLSLTNAGKIVVSISTDKDHIILLIKDDASNREQSREKNANHLRNIGNRVELLNGKIVLPEGSPQGSILKIVLPLV